MNILNRLKNVLFPLLFVPVFAIAQEKDVVIRIIQGENTTKLTDFQTTIKLHKQAFKFQVLLNNVEGVYVFASIRDSVYRFTETSPIRDFSYLKLLEIREADKFNLNKELNLSETGWSYWYYNDTTQWHSFARKTVGLGDQGVLCTKEIRKLYHTDAAEILKFKTMTTPLYIFFIAVKEYDAQGKPVTELMRRKVKIEWDDVD